MLQTVATPLENMCAGTRHALWRWPYFSWWINKIKLFFFKPVSLLYCRTSYGAKFNGLLHIREQAGQNTAIRIWKGVNRKTGNPAVDYEFVLWLEVRSLLLCLSLALTFQSEVVTFTLNIHKFHALPTQYICMFCVNLGTNSDYFPVQRWLGGFCKEWKPALF